MPCNFFRWSLSASIIMASLRIQRYWRASVRKLLYPIWTYVLPTKSCSRTVQMSIYVVILRALTLILEGAPPVIWSRRFPSILNKRSLAYLGNTYKSCWASTKKIQLLIGVRKIRPSIWSPPGHHVVAPKSMALRKAPN